LSALGLNEIDFSEGVDFEYDENIDVPEEFALVPNIVDMLNSLAYQRAMFSTIVEAANHVAVKVVVKKEADYRDPTTLINSINTGNFNSSCGILAYEDGCEEDIAE
jgi:hypothetical protein